MDNNFEILAPVGGKEHLKAAVLAGANAIYLAGKNFGARSFAENFTKEDLKSVVEYCHIRSVKVYITVNTLIKSGELIQVLEYIQYLNSIHVDAIIIQDLGLSKIIKEKFPDLELHASTQMTAHSLEDVLFLEKQGFNRVIISREVSLDEIKYIKENSNVDLEVFVHGALCMSYSGQCLMSSFIGGRSGNRGKCAQPCRKIYTLRDSENKEKLKEGHLLSPKDLCAFDGIDQLKNLGVASIKIEGRMKNPIYVYTVVKVYSELAFFDRLKYVFNRGFTKGFLLEKNITDKEFITEDTPSHKGYLLGEILSCDRDVISIKLEKDVNIQDEIQIRYDNTSVGIRVEKIYKNNKAISKGKKGDVVKIAFNKPSRKGESVYKTYDVDYVNFVDQKLIHEDLDIPIKLTAVFKKNKNPRLRIIDNLNNCVEGSLDYVIESARSQPVTKEKLKEQLMKFGNTPFIVDFIKISMDDDIFIPISLINKLRRKVLNKLINIRKEKFYKKHKKHLSFNLCEKTIIEKNNSKEIVVSVGSLKQLKAALKYPISYIYYKDLQTAKKALELVKNKPVDFYISLPHVSHSKLYKDWEYLKSLGVNICVSTMGQINYFKLNKKVGNFSLNVFNEKTLEFYCNNGLDSVCISPELTFEEINSIANKVDFSIESIIYGYIPVMTIKYPLVKSKDVELIDGYNEVFKFYSLSKNYGQILNSKPIYLLKHYEKLMTSGINRMILNFTIETPDLIEEVIKTHLYLLDDTKAKEFFVLENQLSKKIDFITGHFIKGIN